jgi:hypothetical protein
MLTEVTLLVVQLKTADAPAAMLLGCALNETVGGGFCVDPVTVTTVEDAVVPPAPVAVAV